jgi:BirA family biotin operon repressor/biotin-[acetyl-CoA-carboxylase] ligase
MTPQAASAAEPIVRDRVLENVLSRHISASRLGSPVYAYQRLASTMEQAQRLAREGAEEGTLVVAVQQTQGRGRQGRVWHSPSGGLYCSLVLKPLLPTPEVPQLALVAGLAVAGALREMTKLLPTIRWPNDVLIANRKVAGILVEGNFAIAIVGIGVNVTTDLRVLPETGTSLSANGADFHDPWPVLGAICRHLSSWYDVWRTQGFSPIRAVLRPSLGFFGEPVQLTVGNQQIEGTAHDLDEHGRLVVRLDSGLLRAFAMGEVTLLR